MCSSAHPERVYCKIYLFYLKYVSDALYGNLVWKGIIKLNSTASPRCATNKTKVLYVYSC